MADLRPYPDGQGGTAGQMPPKTVVPLQNAGSELEKTASWQVPQDAPPHGSHVSRGMPPDGAPAARRERTEHADVRWHHARPSISVVMHVYNMGRHLNETINSLRAQTFHDFDVVCISDASRDGSGQMLHRVADVDRRFRVIDTRGLGQAAGLNLGMREARGSYVCLLKSDDFLDKDALLKMAHAAKTTQADVIKANQWLYWSEPKSHARASLAIGPSIADHVLVATREPEVLFACCTPWGGLYKRSHLQAHGISMLEGQGSLVHHIDFGFMALVCAERVFCLQEPLLYARQDNIGGTFDRRQDVFRICDEFDVIEDFIGSPQAAAELRPLRPYVYRMRFDAYSMNLALVAPAMLDEFLAEMAGDMARGMQDGDFVPELFTQQQAAALRLLLSDPRGFAESLLEAGAPQPQPTRRRSRFGRKGS